MLRLVKVLVSAGLITLLIWKADLGEFWNDLDRVRPGLTILAVVLLALQYPVSAWKWRISLRLHGVDYPYLYLLRVLCIAFFFNNFLPTAIGGDGYRAVRTMDKSTRKIYSISAVILERLVGLLVLVFLGYLCAIYLIIDGDLLHGRWLAAAVMVVTAALLVLLLAFWLGLHTKLIRGLKKVPKLEPIYESLRVLSNNSAKFFGLVGASLVFQLLAIGVIGMLFAALGLPWKLAESGFTAATAGVAGMLPISINGIGVIEGSFVAAAWESGLPSTDAIVVALFLRIFMLASSVVFGLMYAVEPRTPIGSTSEGDATDATPAKKTPLPASDGSS